MDLKNAVADEVNGLLEPVRQKMKEKALSDKLAQNGMTDHPLN